MQIRVLKSPRNTIPSLGNEIRGAQWKRDLMCEACRNVKFTHCSRVNISFVARPESGHGFTNGNMWVKYEPKIKGKIADKISAK